MIKTYPSEVLIAAWPRDNYSLLYDKIKGLSATGLSAVSLRRELVESVRHLLLEDRDSRIKLAMGDLRRVNQDAQIYWWEEIKRDPLLVKLAIEQKMHTGYMTPTKTNALFEEWMGMDSTGQEIAMFVWDGAVSTHVKPYLLHNILAATAYNQDRADQWEGRVLSCWNSCPTKRKEELFKQVFLHGTSASHPASRKGVRHWLSLLLDDAPSTRQAVETSLQYGQALIASPDDIVGMLSSHLQNRQLEDNTVLDNGLLRTRVRL